MLVEKKIQKENKETKQEGIKVKNKKIVKIIQRNKQ
jgi:hypothetical protein